MINESLVRAAVVCYMLDKGYKAEEVRSELSEQVQRNFRWMPELVILLRKYERERDRYKTFDSFYPNIISFFTDYAREEAKRFDAVK